MPYQHKISRRSLRLSLTVDPDGQVIITSPPFVPKFLLNRFYEQHQAWIEQRQSKIKQRFKVETPDSILIFGQKYQKQFLADLNSPLGIVAAKQQLLINYPHLQGKKAPLQKKIDTFLQNTAIKYLHPRAHALAKQMELKFKRLTTRQQKSRWGSCSSQGNLNFNWRLVHHPTAVIDYVIIHELAHLVQLNHSAAFWQLVGKYDPAYPTHRAYLKKISL